MISEMLFGAAKFWSQTRSRITHYEIQPDGTIKTEFINPSDKSEKAWDLEQNSKQQISLKGYANPVELQIDNENGNVELQPSGRYRQFMKQNIITQAMSGGGLNEKKMMYLSMANLATLLLFGIIGISVLT